MIEQQLIDIAISYVNSYIDLVNVFACREYETYSSCHTILQIVGYGLPFLIIGAILTWIKDIISFIWECLLELVRMIFRRKGK